MISKWLDLPFHQKVLIGKTFMLVAAVRIGLRLFSFKTLRSILVWFAQRFRDPRQVDDQFSQETTWAVAAVAQRILNDGPCLTQALSTQFLFERRGCPTELIIGVFKDSQGKLHAHAWLERQGVILIGGTPETLAKYTRLTSVEGDKI